MVRAKTQKSHRPASYNPFRVTIDGLSLVFTRANIVGTLLLIIAIVGLVANMVIPTPEFTKDPSGKATEQFVASIPSIPLGILIGWVVAFILISVFILVISAMLHGIASYTAAELSKGRTVSLTEAFNAVLNSFGTYFIVFFLINIKIALWALLFIIPGIHAYYRYSFAGILFFDEDKQLRGDATLQESSRLAKKGLLTLYASHYFFNVITFFFADRLVSLSSQTILYREYTKLDETKTQKPNAHPLSWVALALPIVVFVFLLLLGIALAGTASAPTSK